MIIKYGMDVSWNQIGVLIYRYIQRNFTYSLSLAMEKYSLHPMLRVEYFFYHILTSQFQIMAHFCFGQFSTILRHWFQAVTYISFSRSLLMWYIWVCSNGINLVSRTVFFSLFNINPTSNVIWFPSMCFSGPWPNLI